MYQCTAMSYDLPAGFLVFILDSEFLDVYKLCIYYGYNFVHSYCNSVHVMLFFQCQRLIMLPDIV
jgi:hypothetical protein